MALDERVRRELEHAARPADPGGVYEELIRRKERRRLTRTVGMGVLGLTVVVGSMLAFLGLTRVFDGGTPPVAGMEPSNGAIIFSAGEYPDYDIYRVQPDGTGLTNISATPTEDIDPNVSPDGTRVAFCRFEDGEPLGIWVINVDGTGLAQLTDGEDCYPAWSPDGSQIVFERTSGGGSDLMVMSSDGSGLRRLVAGPGAGGASPAWSPSGEWIAFNGGYVGGPEKMDTAIYVVRPDGSDLTMVGNGPGQDLFPAWSPDGRQIAFVTDRFVGDPESYPPVVAVMNADGSNVRQLTAGGDDYSDREPFWSPDGERIGFVRGGEGGGIYTMAADGSDLTLVASATDLPLYCCPRPSWQPIWNAVTPSPPIPSESPTTLPSPSETPSPFEDIGLGFPVCGVTSVSGVFAPEVDGTAFVATRAGDTGGCPEGDGSQVLAVDATGDGLADASYGPLECDRACSAYAAPDVDGDGTDELLIQNVQFSITGLKLFEVIVDGGPVQIVPVTVTPPGTAAFGYQGFDGGVEPQFWLGGDAGAADAIRCEPYAGGRAFVSTTAAVPVDAPGDWDVAETWFVLEDAELRVVDVRQFAWPVNDDTVPFLQTGGCGADLDPFG